MDRTGELAAWAKLGQNKVEFLLDLTCQSAAVGTTSAATGAGFGMLNSSEASPPVVSHMFCLS